jgi:serine protease
MASTSKALLGWLGWVVWAAGCGVEATPDATPDRPIVSAPTADAIADEVLVRFRDDVSVDQAIAAVGKRGGIVVARGTHTGYYVARFPGAQKTGAAAKGLAADRVVLEATPNHLTRGQGVGTSPSGPLQQYQWYFTAMGADPWAGFPRADGVIVAILDTGIAYESYVDGTGRYTLAPDLAQTDFAPGYDFINHDAHPNDDQRHGTHVAGIIAASKGITPVARGATLLPIKVLGGDNVGTELALAEGIRYAVDHGADVINMSLTFPPGYFPSRLLGDAIEYASQHGVVMVAAAGNQGVPVVSYPAAFRDVISVGATALPQDRGGPFWRLLSSIERAGYSNHSYKIDVVAPGGQIEGDLDQNGFPEAVLAQTFSSSDRSKFEYTFYAGTSQATALVTGVVAVMKAMRPSLTPYELRGLLHDTARSPGPGFLSDETGRGMMQAYVALVASWLPRLDRARYLAQVAITLHDKGNGTIARAHVEILDRDRRPAREVEVYGQWTGAAALTVVGKTDRNGLLELDSPPLSAPHVVAFQVDGVTRNRMQFDRPRGFFRIDARSLDMLSRFGVLVDGVGTSPSGGDGVGTSPSGGAGVGTSPSAVGTSPSEPLTLAFDASLFAGTGYRSTLLMPNFSWGMATVPMAVAVDEAWYVGQFPAASGRRVVSRGRGWGASPLKFDPQSFPLPISAGTGDTVALVVLTYTSGVGTSPSGVGTSPSGVGTSPSIEVDRIYGATSNRDADAYDAMLGSWYQAGQVTAPASSLGAAGTLAQAVQAYFRFAPRPIAAPVGAYGPTLQAAGRGVAPATRP